MRGFVVEKIGVFLVQWYWYDTFWIILLEEHSGNLVWNSNFEAGNAHKSGFCL